MAEEEPKKVLPEWWPEWMEPPVKYPLGRCKECGQQQYSMSSREDHTPGCSRFEQVYLPTPFRKVPWPKTYVG